MDLLENKKFEFLNKYNPENSIETAISKAIRAAVQHNTLYTENLPQDEKSHVRKVWGEHLKSLNEKYKFSQSVETYEKDILSLQLIMNNQFSDFFRTAPHPKYQYAPGFRVSHSQKSISVYLKHLWCLGIIAEPPQCPVDAIILKIAGCNPEERKWCHVNSINDHNIKINILKKKADLKKVTLAQWELLQFETETQDS